MGEGSVSAPSPCWLTLPRAWRPTRSLSPGQPSSRWLWAVCLIFSGRASEQAGLTLNRCDIGQVFSELSRAEPSGHIARGSTDSQRNSQVKESETGRQVERKIQDMIPERLGQVLTNQSVGMFTRRTQTASFSRCLSGQSVSQVGETVRS